MSGRRKARELALCALYAYEFSQNPVEQIVREVITNNKNSENITSFASSLLELTIKNVVQLDEIIKFKALNWDFQRIAVIDKLIMRLAICEFLYFPEIPPKVTIDEAIEVAKKYSTENSGKFINGILDAVLSELRKSDQLKKLGRGLIE